MTDLTGAWNGIFNYASDLPATAFAAELLDAAGAISGAIDEPDIHSADGAAIQALIDGHRDDSVVRFVKYYDDPAENYDIVHYEGIVAEDGTEITGRWDIPGAWSGTFIMTREAPPGAIVEMAVAETIER